MLSLLDILRISIGDLVSAGEGFTVWIAILESYADSADAGFMSTFMACSRNIS